MPDRRGLKERARNPMYGSMLVGTLFIALAASVAGGGETGPTIVTTCSLLLVSAVLGLFLPPFTRRDHRLFRIIYLPSLAGLALVAVLIWKAVA